MPTARKSKTTSKPFSRAEIAAARAATRPGVRGAAIDWSAGVVSPGGGVAATIAALRRARDAGRKPQMEQVALRLDTDVLAAFKSAGPGWQARVNVALKEWLAIRPAKRRLRGESAR